jgi:hypothetical protein
MRLIWIKDSEKKRGRPGLLRCGTPCFPRAVRLGLRDDAAWITEKRACTGDLYPNLWLRTGASGRFSLCLHLSMAEDSAAAGKTGSGSFFAGPAMKPGALPMAGAAPSLCQGRSSRSPSEARPLRSVAKPEKSANLLPQDRFCH